MVTRYGLSGKGRLGNRHDEAFQAWIKHLMAMIAGAMASHLFRLSQALLQDAPEDVGSSQGQIASVIGRPTC